MLKGFATARAATDEFYKSQISDDKAALNDAIQNIELRFTQGKITQQQEIAEIAKAKEQELQLEKLAQEQRFAVWQGDVKKQAEIQAEINKIVAQAHSVEVKSVTDAAKAEADVYKKAFSQMTSVFSGFTSSLISSQKNLQQAWTSMVTGMASKLAEGLEAMLMKSIQNDLLRLATHVQTNETAVASDAAAAAQSKSISLSQSLANIQHAAAAAAARVYEAESYLGPVIAGALAAGTYVAVLGFGAMAGGAASAEGGQYLVPNNQLTMLHPQEMVLPAGLANQMRNVIGGGKGGGGGITVVVNHSVSAIDAQSFQGTIRKHANMIGTEVARSLKKKRIGGQ
jgi:hypothetical protein